MPKKSATSGKKKPTVQVRDMTSRNDPKGGAFNTFLKLGGTKGESFRHSHKHGHKQTENKLP
jgi:hypothetical protein